MHLPGRLQSRDVDERDYVFASGISGALVGGTFNLINSRIRPFGKGLTTGGPRMAIPGAFMYGFAGLVGQFIANGVERWRIRYVLENEEKWKALKENKKSKESDEPVEFERRFDFLEKFKLVRRADPEKRIQTLREEIENVDKMLKKVDDEIAGLEKGGNEK